MPSVLDGLAEDAVLISQAVAHGGELHGRRRFNEACCEAPQPAVSQACVRLLLRDLNDTELLVLEDLLCKRAKQQVHHVIRQRPPSEKLHRKIIEPLRVLLLVSLLGQQPALRQDVADRPGHRLKAIAVCGCGGIQSDIEEQMPFIERVTRPRELHRTASVLSFKKAFSIG